MPHGILISAAARKEGATGRASARSHLMLKIHDLERKGI
jgi:hypothetical protein